VWSALDGKVWIWWLIFSSLRLYSALRIWAVGQVVMVGQEW
jgi:hypothetical protein